MGQLDDRRESTFKSGNAKSGNGSGMQALNGILSANGSKRAVAFGARRCYVRAKQCDEASMSEEAFELLVGPGTKTGTTVITVNGKIVVENLAAVRQAFQEVSTDMLVWDLSGVTYVDSSGIGALMNAYTSRTNRGKKMAIAGAQERVQRLMKLTMVDKVLKLYPDKGAAEASI
jgi:anti-sigma B factor antagonist